MKTNLIIAISIEQKSKHSSRVFLSQLLNHIQYLNKKKQDYEFQEIFNHYKNKIKN